MKIVNALFGPVTFVTSRGRVLRQIQPSGVYLRAVAVDRPAGTLPVGDFEIPVIEREWHVAPQLVDELGLEPGDALIATTLAAPRLVDLVPEGVTIYAPDMMTAVRSDNRVIGIRRLLRVRSREEER